MGAGAYCEQKPSGRARCKVCGELIRKNQSAIRFVYGAGNYTGVSYIHNNPYDCHESRQSLRDLLITAGGEKDA